MVSFMAIYQYKMLFVRLHVYRFIKTLSLLSILSKNENLTLRIFATKFLILDKAMIFFALRPQNILMFLDLNIVMLTSPGFFLKEAKLCMECGRF